VEDQQPDSGDLTTDEASDAKAVRRRHRMPLRKGLAPSEDEAADTTDEKPETAEPAEVAEPAEAEHASPRRRWRFLRRAAKAPEPKAVSVADEVAALEEPAAGLAPRTPVGKAARTAKPVTEPEETADEEPADEEPADEEPADEQPTVELPADESPEPDEPPVLVPHRPAGKRLTIAAAAAGVVFVGAAAFAGATLEPYLADRALVHTKLDIARTAANAITTLLTYNPDNMEALPERAAGYLGGDFANEYRKYIDAIVAPNKQAQVTNTTEVMGTAVETVTPTEATALVYTNSVATSPASKNIPSLRYLSYRLTLQRHDAKWLITRMSTVTSFDLTPQL
jgi:Mce-associated membrane protein